MDKKRGSPQSSAHGAVLGQQGEGRGPATRHDDALADLSRAIELSPDDAWAAARRGDTYRQMERYADALADLTRAIELDPEDAWAIASRGEAYRQMER